MNGASYWRDWQGMSPAARLLITNGLAFNLGFYMMMPFLAQHMGSSDRQFQGDLGGQFQVRGAANPVRTEESSHARPRISACCTEEPCGPS